MLDKLDTLGNLLEIVDKLYIVGGGQKQGGHDGCDGRRRYQTRGKQGD